MGLIYELTADTYDATEAAKWTVTGAANVTMTATDDGLLKITADPYDVHDEYGTLQREALDTADTPAGRYVLVVDAVESPDRRSGLPVPVSPVSIDVSIYLGIPGGTGGINGLSTDRYMAAANLDPTDDPFVPTINQVITTDAGDGLYLSRIALYLVDDRHLIDQLAVQILTPGTDGFRLDTDTLGTGRLGSRATATAWTDYLTNATGLVIDRGADTDGVETTTQVGAATLTVKADQGAAPGLGLRPNLPIRVRSKLTETVAYTGAVGDLTDTWRKPTGPGPMSFFVSVPCVDAVRDLAGISRNGALAIDSWAGRVRRIMASYTGAWAFAPGTYDTAQWPVMARTVYESTLDKHLQLAVNSSAGRWYVDRNNVVRVEQSNWTAQARPVRLRLVDTEDAAGIDPRARYYTDLTRTYDTRALVNELSFANHDAVLNDSGEWVANDATLGPFTNRTSAATYGVRHADIDTCLETGPGDPDNDLVPSADPAGALVAEYTRDNAKPAIRFLDVTYDATNDVDIACSLDVFDLVLVTNGDIVDQRNRIIGIRHDITTKPERWLVTLTLQAWSV